ncbi:S-layer homology domain-containing protein [Chakrabartyella piscis]|uniref:S-layer homology domain-containing protein n=1 Tax=Chakrabartyella piscis TaxID=2918914 RepID=UPI002958412A|nr:S-layer homology domain-containing protein [Chakrabartyella piscis]
MRIYATVYEINETETALDQLVVLIAEINALNEEDYTAESWSAFDSYATLLAQNEESLRNVLSETAAEGYLTQLTAAKDGLVSAEPTALDQLVVLIAEINALNEEDYTAESWSAFNSYATLLAQTEESLRNVLSETAAEGYLTQLTAAKDGLVSAEPTALDQLVVLIAEINALNEEDYTAESWSAFDSYATLLAQTEESLRNVLSETAAEGYLTQLTAAKDGLVSAEPTALDQLVVLIAEINALNEEDYTAESWSAFDSYATLLAQTEESLRNVLSETAAEGYLTQLTAAKDGLVSAEPTALDKLVVLIAEINALNEEDYTAESWSAFDSYATLLAQTEESLRNVLSETAAEGYLTQLTAAKDGLVLAEVSSVDKLIELIAEINALNEEDYTAESWSAFDSYSNLLAQSDDAIRTLSESVAELYITALTTAKEGLVLAEVSSVDKLIELIAEINALNEEDYTAESWSAFDSYSNLLAQSDDAIRTLSESVAELYISALTTAKEGLVLASSIERLIILIAEINALNEEDYTAESWSAVASYSDLLAQSDDDIRTLPENVAELYITALTAAVEGLVLAGSASTSEFEDGVYAVDFVLYNSRLKTSTPGLYNPEIGRQVFLEVENGEYTVTFRKVDTDLDVRMQILNQEYYSDTETLFGQQSGDKNFLPSINIDDLVYNSAVEAGWDATYNHYWYDTDYEVNENYTDYSVPMVDMSSDILSLIYESKYSAGYMTSRMGYIDFSETTAEKIDLEAFRAASTVGLKVIKAYENTTIADGVSVDAFVTENAKWDVEDDIATLTVAIADDYVDMMNAATITIWNGEDTFKLTDNSLVFEFDLSDASDIALGRTIYVQADGNSNVRMIYIYPTMEEVEDVIITDSATGARVVTTSNILPDTTSLNAYEITSNSSDTEDAAAYSLFYNNLANLVNDGHMQMYNYYYESASGTQFSTTSQAVRMEFKIPSGWDEDQIKLSYWGGTGTGGIDLDTSVTATLVGVENGYYVIETTKIGYFCLHEMKDLTQAGTGEGFADGTYSIPLSVYHLTSENQLSMADQCLNGDVTIVVKDGVKTIYFDFEGVTIDTSFGYMTQMWLYDEDMTFSGTSVSGSTTQVVYTDYLMDDDGNFLNDVYNEGGFNYYPTTGYATLVSDDAQWPVRFRVPIMDLIGGGDYAQDAWLTLDWANAEKTSDETPEPPIGDALNEVIAIANVVTGDFPTSLSETFLEAKTAAETVAANEDATFAEQTAAQVALRDAIDALIYLTDGDDSGSGGGTITPPTGTNDEMEVGSYYYVGVELWHSTNSQLSMGDSAFENNRNALVYVEDDGYYIEVATNPITIADITAGIGSVYGDSNMSSVQILETETLPNGEDYIAKFAFNTDDQEDSYMITVTVPGSPMVGSFDARLVLDWTNATETSDTSLKQDSSAAAGSVTTEEELETEEAVADAVTEDGKTTVEITASATQNGSTIESSVSEETMSAAIENAIGADEDATVEIIITIPTTTTSTGMEVTLPANALEVLSETEGATLVINSDKETLTIDQEAMQAIHEQADGKEFTIAIAAADTDELSDAAQEAIGDAVVYELSILVDGEKITDFNGGSLYFTLPYTLADEEVSEGIVVYYVDDEGNKEARETTHDADTNEVRFKTGRLSVYMIGYEEVVEVWESPFTDVSASDWFFSAVEFAVENGIFSGTTETTFSPNQDMTRAMLVTVLWRMEDQPYTTTRGMYEFTDVVEDAYYETAVQWAAENGIVSGYSEDVFGVNDVVTREQLVAILQRYTAFKDADVSAEADLSGYVDAENIAGYATSAFGWAVEKGIVSGTSETELSPKSGATRAQVARILENLAK